MQYMEKQAFIAYLLCGAFMMELLSGGAVLLSRRDQSTPGQQAKSTMCRLLGSTMLLFMVLLLVSVILTHTGSRSEHGTAFVAANITFIAIAAPYLYLLSHTIRYGKLPSRGKTLPHFLSLLLPAGWLVTASEHWMQAAMIYAAACAVGVPVYHGLWFKWHREMWKKYDDRYRRQSVWQMWLILVPVATHILLYVWCLSQQSLNAFYGYFAAGIVLWGAAFHRTCFYNPSPAEETDCIADLDPQDDSASLPAPLRNQIARGLARAEEAQLHLKTDIDLDTYAQFVGTNRTYLSRYFNQVLSTTFYDYLNAHRLEHAKELMRQGGCRIKDVAFSCGYIDITTFRRNFKKYVGCPPKQFADYMEKGEV